MATETKTLTISDYDDIIRVWSDAGLPLKPLGRDSREMMATEMALPGVAYFGLFESDRLVGVAIANYDGRRGWINHLAVDPERRGEGLASLLIQKCESYLKKQGAVVIASLIEEINMPSISAFQKAGFVCMEEFKYFSKRESSDS